MSSAMYNKMWHQTQEALNSLLDKESQNITEPRRSQVFIFQTLATFYIKYVQIFRNLENAYDQIVHPQKRILIRKVLDGVMGRILELKNEMVNLELTEFHYFDDILQDLKLAPEQLDIPIPKYFLKEKLEIIKGREKILAQILADSGLDMSELKYPGKSIPLEEAIKLIQIAERARQGRLRAIFMKQIFLREYRAKQARLLGEKGADVGAAALHIQKVWRGFCQSKKTEKERQEEMVFLGMNPPPLFDEVSATIIQAEKVTCLRNEVQIKHEEDYKEAMVTIKGDLKVVEGPDMKENLQDQIRHWFIECSLCQVRNPGVHAGEHQNSSAVCFYEDDRWILRISGTTRGWDSSKGTAAALAESPGGHANATCAKQSVGYFVPAGEGSEGIITPCDMEVTLPESTPRPDGRSWKKPQIREPSPGQLGREVTQPRRLEMQHEGVAGVGSFEAEAVTRDFTPTDSICNDPVPKEVTLSGPRGWDLEVRDWRGTQCGPQHLVRTVFTGTVHAKESRKLDEDSGGWEQGWGTKRETVCFLHDRDLSASQVHRAAPFWWEPLRNVGLEVPSRPACVTGSRGPFYQ
ncbi:IQ and AAA domain-containing protein 1-like [Pteropus vampyrus]|uniref:IQ and AAA domain-containing protein 1-like n=1 Tax=Pteropus vampyrus TaxID=132908 RepID=A0A6P3RAX6_PTEVA|nr:IQ and AAA domain-containing protein 1-like [Pteropus vampyrus]